MYISPALKGNGWLNHCYLDIVGNFILKGFRTKISREAVKGANEQLHTVSQQHHNVCRLGTEGLNVTCSKALCVSVMLYSAKLCCDKCPCMHTSSHHIQKITTGCRLYTSSAFFLQLHRCLFFIHAI